MATTTTPALPTDGRSRWLRPRREAAALRPGTAANGLPRVVVAHEGLTLSP